MNVGRRLAWAVFGPVLVACSLLTTFDGIVPSSDGGVVGPLDAEVDSASPVYAACDLYYQAYVARCAFAGYPPSVIARLEPRWDTACAALVDVPGVAYTASEMTACAQTLATVSCNDYGLPPACTAFFEGTLGADAPCLSGQQCQSGACGEPGGTGSGCFLCYPVLANGQPCETASSYCLPGSECSLSSGTCVPAIPAADLGGSCLSNVCTLGLVCGSVSKTCVQPTFVGPTQFCDGETTACQVGACPLTYTDGGVVPGDCPAIIGDGQVCDPASLTTTCDAFALCLGNTCTLVPSPSSCP